MLNFLRKLLGMDTLIVVQISALQCEVELLREFLEQERAEKEEYKRLALSTVGLIKQVDSSSPEVQGKEPKPVTKARNWNKVRANLEMASLEASWKAKGAKIKEVKKQDETAG